MVSLQCVSSLVFNFNVQPSVHYSTAGSSSFAALRGEYLHVTFGPEDHTSEMHQTDQSSSPGPIVAPINGISCGSQSAQI